MEVCLETLTRVLMANDVIHQIVINHLVWKGINRVNL